MTRPCPISRYCPINMCYPMARTLLRMRRKRVKSTETYGYDMVAGIKTVGFRSNAPAGPKTESRSAKFNRTAKQFVIKGFVPPFKRHPAQRSQVTIQQIIARAQKCVFLRRFDTKIKGLANRISLFVLMIDTIPPKNVPTVVFGCANAKFRYSRYIVSSCHISHIRVSLVLARLILLPPKFQAASPEIMSATTKAASLTFESALN